MKLLFTSDFHLRNDNPINRIDDFQEIQLTTLKQIASICKLNKAKLIIAGDIFHKAKKNMSIIFCALIYEIFKDIAIDFIAGNHDLLYHSMENFNISNIGLLNKFDNWNHKKYDNHKRFFDFGEEIKNDTNGICVLHKYCEKDKLPSYIAEGITAKYLLEMYDYDIFVVGDNHKSFIYEKDNRFVFNTGCITRQSLTEKDYKPSVILFDTETKEYEQIYLLDNQKNVFKEENAAIQIKRENRIDSFIKLVGENKDISFSYTDNLNKYCQENKIAKEIINEIDNILEED